MERRHLGLRRQSRLDYTYVQNDNASFVFTITIRRNGAAWNCITSNYDPQGVLQNTFVQNDVGAIWFF